MRALALAFLLAWPACSQEPPKPPLPERQLPDTAELERELKRLVDVFLVVDENAADAVNRDQAFYGGAIPGMLRRLDPHSVFFDKHQFEQLQEMERSVSKGFGSIVSLLPGRVIVLQTTPGTPSQKSGLAPGDEIVAINNIALSQLNIDQLVELLSMARQNQAQLLVRRQGTAKLMGFTLTPEELQAPSVDRAFTIAAGIGYVRSTSFDTNTASEIQNAIEKLGGRRLEGLVLDLRDNPGGVLQAGLATAALFLKPSTRILSARGRSSETENVDAPKDTQPYTFRLAVLVNGKTASAAEIVAGAIQDNDRGVLLGETSFGKGLVQRVFPLSEGTGLALTTAFYYTPSGRSIQKPLKDNELAAATATTRPEFKTAGGRRVRGGGGIEPDTTVLPFAPSRLQAFLETAAAYSNYTTEWLATHRADAARDMEISPAMMDDFQLWLSRHNVRPTLSEWTADAELIRRRLKQEILNQGVSVAAGDEVELRADPLIRRALEKLQEP